MGPSVGVSLRTLVAPRRVAAGVTVGLAGGALLALPVVLYDWAKAGHSALELPMAAAAWPFGLNHFAQNGYRWSPIVVGAVLIVAYAILSGLLFAGIADRVFSITTIEGSIAAGFAWGIASFMVFWYVVLAIARDGAPFRMTAASSAMVAPTWVFILGFVAFGVVSGMVYRSLRERATT